MIVPSKRLRKTLTLISLLMVFGGPLLLAIWVYFSVEHLPSNENGILIHPPQAISFGRYSESTGLPVDERTIKGRWALMLYLSQNLSTNIKQAEFLKRIHLALGKNQSRVKPIVVTTKKLANESLDLLASCKRFALHHWLSDLSAGLPNIPNQPNVHGVITLVSPVGRVMMYYLAKTPPKLVLADLERLLKVSQIG